MAPTAANPYDVLHFPILGACLIWLYARHRDFYPRVRTTVALFTGVSLLIQLIPVTPPRLLPATGMVDTAVRYGQSVYSWQGGFDADEFSAMPSVHVGWALIVAIAVITVSRSRWRWLAAGYPVLTLLVVVVTANHFWLDGIVAALLVALVLVVQRKAPARCCCCPPARSGIRPAPGRRRSRTPRGAVIILAAGWYRHPATVATGGR
jgi:hypothetical protein